jgi:hypothetical protein
MEILSLILLGAFFILGALLTEIENFGWTTLCFIVTLALLGVHFECNPATYVWEHKLDIFKHLTGYVGIGIVWSFVRWVLHLRKFRSLFRHLKAEYSKHPKADLDEPLIPTSWAWKQVLDAAKLPEHHTVDLSRLRIPRASNHKARITAWASYWPYSIVGYLGNLLFHDLIIAIYEKLQWFYEHAAKWMFRNDRDLS